MGATRSGFKMVSAHFLLSVIFFTSSCSAAPAKRRYYRHEKLLFGLMRLEHIAEQSFKKYEDIHFGDRTKDNKPTLHLGIQRKFWKIKSPESTSEENCRQLEEFITPVYLAYYDESRRANSDSELTKLLGRASSYLNMTASFARYVHHRKFPKAKKTQLPTVWSRNVLLKKVSSYKTKTRDPGGINELRSWATLSELKDLPWDLAYSYMKIGFFS